MYTLELFSATKSFSKVMAEHGHKTKTVDISPEFDPDIRSDIRSLYIKGRTPKHSLVDSRLAGTFDVIWASPPCEAFSVAAIGKNWGGGFRAYEPKRPEAREAIEVVEATLDLINIIEPKWWFIENPQGVLKKMPFMQPYKMHTIWYCHYGDTRAKPTNIWTNALWWQPQPPCHNRRKGHTLTCCCMDHSAAPRGSRTGTQGLSGAIARGVIPPALFEEILEQMPAL